MNKSNIKYYLIPVIYIACLVLMEYFLNVIFVSLWLLAFIASIVGVIALIVNRRKRSPSQRVLLGLLALIPFFDSSLGLSKKVRDAVRGEIVLSIIDDSFVSTRALTIRQRGAELHGEYDFSVAGFGDVEPAHIKINGDTIAFEVRAMSYSDTLVYDRSKQIMKSPNKNLEYRIMINKLIR